MNFEFGKFGVEGLDALGDDGVSKKITSYTYQLI